MICCNGFVITSAFLLMNFCDFDMIVVVVFILHMYFLSIGNCDRRGRDNINGRKKPAVECEPALFPKRSIRPPPSSGGRQSHDPLPLSVFQTLPAKGPRNQEVGGTCLNVSYNF